MSTKCKKKILVFSSSLAGGGAEKHLLRILPYLQNHYEITLALCRNSGELVKDLPKNTSVIELGKGRALKSLLPLISYLNKNKPDLVFSIQDHANAIAIMARYLAFDKQTKLCCSVQNNFSESKKTTPFLRGKILYFLLPWLYRYPDWIITCSEGLKENLKHQLKQPIKIQTIYNASFEQTISTLKPPPCNEPWLENPSIPVIISCGRLVPQKNYPLLISAFKELLESQEARLIIVGNGQEKQNLETLVAELRISDNVKFLPFTNNHYQLMSRASIFVLPSLWEGFGNILVEAMACEVPVIATNCDFGPSEIIEHDKDGLLIESNNKQELKNAMLRLLNDKKLREQLITAAKEKCQHFSSEQIAQEHITLFDSLLCQR